MSPATRISLLYSLFAGVSTLVNLTSQALVMALYQGPWNVETSILAGTAAGLPTKYLLDKRHIFRFQPDNLAHDGQLFLLYAGTGLVTTALFWGIEYGFHLLFEAAAMRYLGGALGLSLGFLLKYQLDRRFVFVTAGRSD